MTSIDTERFREALLDERRRVEHALATLRDEHRGSLDEEVEEIGASDNHLAETATATLGREIDYTLGENSGQVLAADRRRTEAHRRGHIRHVRELRTNRSGTNAWKRPRGLSLHRLQAESRGG